MPAERVICWVLVISLPLTLPAMLAHLAREPARAAAWGGFAYVTVFSMWLGFFAWYRGLALGGTLRVSQVQLVQPFLAMLFAVPVLGERLDATTVAFALAVVATVFVGRWMSVGVVFVARQAVAGRNAGRVVVHFLAEAPMNRAPLPRPGSSLRAPRA